MLSLRLRFVLTLLLLVAILLGGVTLATMRESLMVTRTELATADQDANEVLEELARTALRNGDLTSFSAAIGRLGEDSRVDGVALADRSGRVVASTDSGEIGRHWRVPPPVSEVRVVADGARTLGWLRILHPGAAFDHARTEVVRVGMGMAAIGVIGILLVGWAAGGFLTRRLSRLAAVADQVTAGDLTRRAAIAGDDEVARVGRAFDAMVGHLEKQFENMRRDRDRLELPSEAINEGYLLWDGQERLVRCNERCRELFGAAGKDIALGMTYEAFLAGPVRRSVSANYGPWETRMAAMLDRHRRGGEMVEVGLRDGRWLRVSKSRLPDGSVIGIYTDITEAKTRELALEQSEQQLRAIMESVGEGIVVLDPDDRVRVANPAAAEIFGREAGTLDGLPFQALILGERERPGAAAPQQRREMLGVRADGTRFPAEVAFGRLGDAGGMRIVTVRDVTAEKADRDRILLQATHDELTALPNRRLFDDRLDMHLRRAARTGEMVAVAFLDVDRFKTINDSLGHAVGDRLLVSLSRRLRASLRESDTVARMGGDEFIFILPGLNRPEDALAPVRKLVEALRAPVWIDGHELHVTASIGVAVHPGDGQDRDLLLRHADSALYRAKARGRNRFELYDPSLASENAARVRLDADLRAAGGTDELSLAYQPQVNFRTGRVLGFEALMRWDHPQLGLVAPDTFIPIAEESGQIASLGIWALERACRDMKTWDRCGIGPLRLAVNVSQRQLQQDGLPAQIERVLADTGLLAERLELEFTEAALLSESEAVARTLAALDRLGVGLVLDDFGAGAASLGLLRRFPIRRLKMDASAVRDMVRDRGDAALARAIISVARDLRIGVVAEGVETAEQLAMLGSFGCEEAQGFFLGRPMPARDVAGTLRIAA